MQNRWMLVALALCLPTSQAYPMYGEEIPNGDFIPHPCKPNYLWKGVGHQNAQGGGARNPFGEDFARNGHKWTEALCRSDSDGDGMTNGQELGDPECVWTKGQVPPRTTDITHPGVCDPWNDSRCATKNAWVDCTIDEFQCDAINDPDVLNITLRFPRTKVPAKETTYICFNFELPDDRAYHLIAAEPFIDNNNVMHHIVLSKCSDNVQLLDEPQECLMGTEGCEEVLELWGLGLSGSCLAPETGYLIGQGGTRVVSMQFHWTNPNAVDTWYDSSGFTLYYTPKLRKYNAGILTIGLNHLNIPPRQNAWTEEGGCSGRCTQKHFQGDIEVFKLIHHMHYLGIRQNVTLTRHDSNQFEVLADDNPYSYDNPKVHDFENPITVRPGDSLMTHCTYQSRSRTEVTTFGEGSFDEMCFAFIFFYPEENVQGDSCTTYKDVDSCILEEVCSDQQIFNSSNPTLASAVHKVLTNCDVTGSACWQHCPESVEAALNSNPCFKDAWTYWVDIVYAYVPDPYLYRFISAIGSCRGGSSGHHVTTEAPHHVTTTKAPYPATTPTAKPPMVPGGEPGSWILELVKHLDARPLLQNIIMNVNYNNHHQAPSTHDQQHDEEDED